MVSLLPTKSGWVLQLGVDRGRPTIPLGRISKHAAETVRTHVRHLERAAKTNTLPPVGTAGWADGVEPKIRTKLEAARLLAPRAGSSPVTLGVMLEQYVARRTDLKERTLSNLRQVQGGLVAHFGAGRFVRSINAAEAADWRRGLAARLAAATVATHVKKARQFFADAVDRGLCADNPFRKLKTGSQANDANQEYVRRVDALKVIDACPDWQWRAVFALARFGGLRIPSELRGLVWDDVNLSAARMVVRSPKTERHPGRALRVVPIDVDLGRYLEEALLLCEEGAKHVVPRLRLNSNLGTTAQKIIVRAGLLPWPRTFQNLRSSCETDWADLVGSQAAARWAGNTPAVAHKHYLQVTDDHFAKATQLRTAPGAVEDSGTTRKNAVQQSKTPRKAEGSVAPDYPQGESNRPPKYPRSPRILKTALRRALRAKGDRR